MRWFTPKGNLAGALDITANGMTVVLVLILAVILVKGNFVASRSRVVSQPRPINIGTSLAKSPLQVNWVANQRTLVLGLQTTCHFCTASAPFFQKLVDAAPPDLKIVAVLPQTVDVAKRYLDHLGLRVDDVRQASLSALGIAATPTLLLVDELGKVTDMWTGEQTPEGEISVLSEIQDTTAMNDPPGTRRVRLERYKQNDPVRIAQILEGTTDVTPGDRPFKPWQGKPFQAGDDWVKNLTVVVKSLSKKEIVAASISISFPESEPIPQNPTGERVIGYGITLGRKPAQYARTPDGEVLEPASTNAPLSIGVGEELTIHLSNYYDDIKESVETVRPIADISTCWVDVARIYFEDGTQWAAGVFYKPDPSAPGKFVPMDTDEWWGMSKTGAD